MMVAMVVLMMLRWLGLMAWDRYVVKPRVWKAISRGREQGPQ
jgi:hypothetical protein